MRKETEKVVVGMLTELLVLIDDENGGVPRQIQDLKLREMEKALRRIEYVMTKED